jgi:DHA2 family multidrug resistance protein
MTSATGLYNLVRQLGGSFGTAIFATMLERGTIAQHARLVGFVNPYNPTARQMIGGMTRGFAAHGGDPFTAHRQALSAIDLLVTQQAAVLTYDRIFMIVAILLLLPFPLVFFFKPPAGRGPSVEH